MDNPRILQSSNNHYTLIPDFDIESDTECGICRKMGD